MPTINLTDIAKIGAKLIIIALLAGIILSFVSSFVALIASLLSKIDVVANSVNGLDMGWFASTIGLVSFLNSLMVSLYVGISILISGTVTILTFKYGILFYKNLMRV